MTDYRFYFIIAGALTVAAVMWAFIVPLERTDCLPLPECPLTWTDISSEDAELCVDRWVEVCREEATR